MAIRPIVLCIHHQIYPNELVNSSLVWDSFYITLMELGRTKMAVFMRFHSKMAILENGENSNMIRMMLMHAYPSATSDLGL